MSLLINVGQQARKERQGGACPGRNIGWNWVGLQEGIEKSSDKRPLSKRDEHGWMSCGDDRSNLRKGLPYWPKDHTKLMQIRNGYISIDCNSWSSAKRCSFYSHDTSLEMTRMKREKGTTWLLRSTKRITTSGRKVWLELNSGKRNRKRIRNRLHVSSSRLMRPLGITLRPIQMKTWLNHNFRITTNHQRSREVVKCFSQA